MSMETDYIAYLESRVCLLDSMITEREALINCLLIAYSTGRNMDKFAKIAHDTIGRPGHERIKRTKEFYDQINASEEKA